jgi:predicted nucleic acid-binding protein
MSAFFFDSSALVKRHINEVGSTWVRSLTRVKAGHTLYIARVNTVEITSAVARRERGGYLSATQSAVMLGHFRRHVTERYSILELTPLQAAQAMLLERAHGLRAYDAVQLAAALEVSRIYQTGGLGSVTMVSADKALNDAATVEGLTVEDPRAHP